MQSLTSGTPRSRSGPVRVPVPGQLAGRELRRRQHARVEDRIRQVKAAGLTNLPCTTSTPTPWRWAAAIVTALAVPQGRLPLTVKLPTTSSDPEDPGPGTPAHPDDTG